MDVAKGFGGDVLALDRRRRLDDRAFGAAAASLRLGAHLSLSARYDVLRSWPPPPVTDQGGGCGGCGSGGGPLSLLGLAAALAWRPRRGRARG